jgi:hypothetical protein
MKRTYVEDHVYIEDKNEFHAPTPVGRTRTMTPEGFLLCEGVRIARTGNQKYAASELTDQQTGKPAVEPGPDGTVIIGREPSEVFRDETIQSFEGKPVTVEHPIKFVDPSNWKHVAVGTTHNVRQGEGDDEDYLVADLLITDEAAIDHVNRDMPEISCGYDSEYEQTQTGRGLQKNIVGNHVALVDRGRAGPRCSIRDSAFKPSEDMKMTVNSQLSWKSRSQRGRFRFSDTVINTPTPAENAEWSKRMATMSGFDGGLQWQGDLQPVGKAVAQVMDALRRVKDSRRQKDALSQAVCAIAEFGNDLGNSEMVGGPSGALISGSQDELTREDVHAANNITPSKAATGDSGGAQMRRVRDQTGNEVAKINAQNAAYWDKATAWQKR